MGNKNEMVVPAKGMAVTWINPFSDLPNSYFIQKTLIEKHGREGLKILDIPPIWWEDNPKREGKNRWFVTLERAGRPIMNAWDEKWGNKPVNFEEIVAVFSWHYLEPVAAGT